MQGAQQRYKEFKYQFKRNREYVLTKSGNTETNDWYYNKTKNKIYYCIIFT